MRILVKVTLAILILIAVATLASSAYFYMQVNKDFSAYEGVYDGQPEYVISLIMSEGDSEYNDKIRSGVYDAAAEYNAAIEFHLVEEKTNELTNSEYIDIARLARLDAVIASGYESKEFIAAVDHAVEEGMPVVISGIYDVQSNRNVFIGTNQYEFGTKAAVLAASAAGTDGYINLAVIIPRGGLGDERDEQIDRRIAGITGKIQTIENMRLVTTLKTSSNIIGAEDITQKIIREYPEVNVIFCMNARDTIAAAQAVVDRNKVGSVKIIGTDVTNEILDFIDKGIIYGVIDRNAYEIGRQSMEGIMNIINGSLQSSYINVQMKEVTQENAYEYAE